MLREGGLSYLTYRTALGDKARSHVKGVFQLALCANGNLLWESRPSILFFLDSHLSAISRNKDLDHLFGLVQPLELIP